MKKIYTFGLAIAAVAALAACNKENNLRPVEQEQEAAESKITIVATTEAVGDPNTKVAISEVGSKFNLNWEGVETLGLANSTNTTYKTDWTVDSYTGTTAQLTGTLMAVTGSTTNWMLATNLFSSTGAAVRADIPANQSYNGANMANNCLLVARANDASVSTIPAVSFKTMNAFMKFSLVKGSAAGGSTNVYTKMYVQNIIVETLGSEVVAGRFEISKTDADWYSSYAGTVDGQTSNKVTLDCTVNDAKGEELSAVAKDFYVALAFGSYASGLKITINVLNQDGDAGKVEKTFGTASGVTIARNTMRALAELTVNPVDDVAPDTYTLIDDPSDVEAGTYYLAALYGGKYYLWTGTISSNDCVTAEYSYNTSTKVLTGEGAAEVSLVATTGGYFVKIGDNFLRVTASGSRKLKLDSTSDVWSFDVSVDSDDNPRGGLLMKEANFNNFVVSANTSTRVLRSYASGTQGNFGVYLFHKD